MKPFKIYRLRDEFITNFLAARHCFLLSLVSFIIDSPPQLFLLHRLEFFFVTISGNPIYVRRPFLMHLFSLVLYFSLLLSVIGQTM